MAQYFIYYHGKQIGPLEKQDLLKYGLNRDSYVWVVGTPSWVAASTIPELADILPPTPPFCQGAYQPHAYSTIYDDVADKKTVAGILAILLGGFGIHYFYLGKIGAGLLTILLLFISCGIWPLLMFIQGIVMLTMDNETFRRKYIDTQTAIPLF